MGCCSAPNCSNKSSKSLRVFLFPRDPERRAKWLKMCRRDKWQPTLHSTLCEVHFEESQFEKARADGWKKLKPNAVPTLFNFTNRSKQITQERRLPTRSVATGSNAEVSPESSCLPEASVSFTEQLSVVHFEESQIEKAHANGRKKVKPNVNSTLFDVPNCPKQITRKWRFPNRSVAKGSNAEVSPESPCLQEASVSFVEPSSVVDFEESHCEIACENGWKRLEPNTVPTLLDVPNCPKQITLKRRLPNRSVAKGTDAEVSPKSTCLQEASVSFTEPSSVEAVLLNKIKVLERRLWLKEKTLRMTRAQLSQLRRKFASLPFLLQQR